MLERLSKRLVPMGRAHRWLRWPILGLLMLAWCLDEGWAFARALGGKLWNAGREAAAHLREAGLTPQGVHDRAERLLDAGIRAANKLPGLWNDMRQTRLPLAYARGREAWNALRQGWLARVETVGKTAPVYLARAKSFAGRTLRGVGGFARRTADRLRADAPEYKRHAPRRAMAAALAIVMCLGMLPVSAFATEWQSTCPHDLGQHDVTCGYAEAVEGALCGHTEHDGNCGFVEAVPGIPCDKNCAETDGDGNLVHAEGCAYTPAVEGVPCQHAQGGHDESCGYIESVAEVPCAHVHDETCGALETPPAPIIVCDLCGGDHEAADCPEAAAPMALTAAEIPTLDSNNAYQNVKYTLTTGSPNTATVSDAVNTSAVTGNLVIPAQVKTSDGATYNVTSIGQDAFTDCSALASVTIPEGVTSIGEAAFYSIKPGAVVTFAGTAALTTVDQDALCTSNKNPLYVVAQGARLVSLNATIPTQPLEAYGMLVAEAPQSPTFEKVNTAGTLKAANPNGNYAACGCYNVQGLKNGTAIPTTSSNHGYYTYLSTDASPTFANAKAVAFPGAGVESYVDGVWVKVDTDFVSGGNYLRLTYTLRSGTDAAIQNVSLGVNADVQIGSDDAASIYPTPTGFRMVDVNKGSGMQFTLNCQNAPGADDVDTMWYGYFPHMNTNLFTDLTSKTDLTKTDSALAFSWKNMTVPASGTITKSVLFGVGESAAPPALPSDPADKPIALYLTTEGQKDITVNAKVRDVSDVTDTLYYTINGGEEQTLGDPVTADGNQQTIAGVIGADNFATDGEYVIKLWIMNSKGAMSEVVAKTLAVSGTTVSGDGLEEGVAPVGPPTLPAVASVTTADSTVTEYADFTAALTAAKATAGSTLKLLDNVTLPDGALNQQDYDMSGTYTLDLAAYTLDVGQKTGVNDRKTPQITSGAVTVTGTTGKIIGYCARAPLISVGGTGTLNLTGGTLETTAKSPAVVVGPGGTLNVSENAAVEDTYNAYPSSNGGAIKNQGTVNVKGGKVSSQRGLAILNSSAGGSNPAAVLTISGGTVTSGADKYDSTGMESNYCTVSNSGTLHITGGTITSQRNYAVYVSNSLTTPAYLSGTPTLTGGMGEVYLGGPGVLYANDNQSSPAYYTGKALRVTGNILNNDYSPIKEGGQIVRGVKTGEGGNAEKFTLTNPGYLLELSDSDLLLKKAPPQVKWGADKDNLTNSGLLTEALAAKPAYMQLQEDISFDETVSFSASSPYTLDLNGHSLIQTHPSKAAIQCGGTMTLCDSTAKMVDGVYTSGKIAGGYIGVTLAYNSTFIMESGSICDRGSYSSNTGIETNGYSLTLKGGYIGGNSYADVEVESKPFVLAGRMEEPISVRYVSGTAGDTVITSDGTYVITADDLAQLTSADPAFGFVLDGTGTAAVVKLVAIPEATWGTDDTYAVGSGTFAQAVIYANGLESGTAYIQLQRDVSRTSTVTFKADKITVLDLNGCTLAGNHVFSVLEVNGNLTMKDSRGGGAVVTGSSPSYAAGGVSVSEGGHFTLESGKIGPTLGNGVSVSGSTEKPALFTMTGGSICRNKGLGVKLSNDTTFDMSDGKITGNGGGVEVSTRDTFHMSGGEITGNNATVADAGGGVTFVANGAAVNLSGSAKITGNVKNGTLNAETGLYTGGTPCNVYLGYNQYSGERKIGGGVFTDGAAIGVTVANLPTTGDRQITSISGAGDYAAVFTSDDAAYEVVNKGGANARDAYLRKIPAYTYTVTFNSQEATTAASPASKTVIDPATKVDALPTPPTKTGYDFGGWWTVENGGGTEFTADTTVTGNLTVYAKWTPAAISVTGVSLNKATLTLYRGVPETLTATVVPANANQAVTWSSSDETIASVDANGKVIGLKSGTTTITATSVADSTKTATCEVTVKIPALYIGDIPVDGTATGTGWAYDMDTKTLTLTDANIAPPVDGWYYAGIYAKDDLNIVLVGENTISKGADSTDKAAYGVVCEKALNISGAGSLSITASGSTKYSSYGIRCNDYTQSGGSVTTMAGGYNHSGYGSYGSYGIDTSSAPKVTGGTLVASGQSAAIETFNSPDVILNTSPPAPTIKAGASEGAAAATNNDGKNLCKYQYNQTGHPLYVSIAYPEARWTATGGATGQGTLVEAVKAVAKVGGTVTVLADQSYGSPNDVLLLAEKDEASYIGLTKDVTLDLNGKALTFSADIASTAPIVLNGNTGTLTITDSSAGKTGKLAADGVVAALHSINGRVKLGGGTYVVTGENAYGAVLYQQTAAPEEQALAGLRAMLAEGFAFDPDTLTPYSTHNMAYTQKQVKVVPAVQEPGVTVEAIEYSNSNLQNATHAIFANGRAITVVAAGNDGAINLYYNDDPSKTPIDLKALGAAAGIEIFEQDGGYALNIITDGKILLGILGGSNNKSVESTSVTVEGGMVSPYLVGGGWGENGSVAGDAQITITGGEVSNLYVGGAKGAKVEGKAILTGTGGSALTISSNLGVDGKSAVPTCQLTLGGGFTAGFLDGGTWKSGIIISKGSKGITSVEIAPDLTTGTLTFFSPYNDGFPNGQLLATGAIAADVAHIRTAQWDGVPPTPQLVGTEIRVYSGEVPAYTYTVTFDADGGTPTTATKTVTAPATNVDALPTAPIRASYDFGGWFTAKNGGGTEFTASTTVTGNLTVYAKWTVKPIAPAQGGEVALPLTQENLDQVFGEGNAEIGNTDPDTITIKNDVKVKDTITIPGDVILDLNGNTITGPEGKPAIIVKGEDSDLTVTGPGSVVGGGGTSPNGSGAPAIKNEGTGDSTVTIGGGADITGGAGSGTGSGGPGIDSGNGGDVVVGDDSSVTGGAGGSNGGDGGHGITGGSGSDVIISGPGGPGGSGSVTGGNGGNNPGGTGGNGGDGIHTGGDIAIGGDGSAQGGNGGSGSSGGDGGNGASIGGGSNTVEGGATGGTGGSGTGSGQGGDGGNGVGGNGSVSGSGSATGGNGGNAETEGQGGSGGTALGENVSGDGLDKTNGKNGLNAKVVIAGNPGTTVKIPDAGKAVEAVLTEEEKQNDKITEVTVTLTVENKTTEKPNADTVETAKPTNTEVGAYFDITLEKTVKETDKGDTTTPVTETQGGKITVTITIPADMRGGSNYVIIRVHNGSAETITPTQSGNDLTFETDKFSTYAIAYTPAGDDPTPPTPPVDSGDSDSTPSYKPSVTEPDHGSVTVTPSYPSKGDKVTITTKPDEGYVVDKIAVTDKNGKDVAVTQGKDGTYTFIQPGGKVSIVVTYKPEGQGTRLPFTDVRESDWFYESVKYVFEAGLMNGTANDKFSPYLDTSRGMIVTILWRLEGAPEATTATPFPDVASDSYCAKAVAWGAENGIVKGYGNGKFGPGDPITREQLAAILYRYAQFKGQETPTEGMAIGNFSDGAQVSAWARDAMRWCLGQGIVSGKGDNRLDPQGKATRAETAVMLQRYLENGSK